MEPGTMMLIGQAISAGSSFFQNQANQKRADEFSKQIQESATVLKDRADDYFSVANYFKPGGQAWKDAYGSALDASYDVARKGREDLLAKGINMTSYGTGVQTDVVKDTFTKNLDEDLAALTKVGSSWANVGAGLLGDYTDLMTEGYAESYSASLSQDSPFGTVGDFLSTKAGAETVSKLFG